MLRVVVSIDRPTVRFVSLRQLPLLAILALCLCWPTFARAQSETESYDNGIDLMGQKKYAEAEVEFRKSITADPRYKEAWKALADVLRAEGKIQQAQAIAKMADAPPATRAGHAPPLTTEQKQVLQETVSATPPATKPLAPATPPTTNPATAAERPPANMPVQAGAVPLPLEASPIVNNNANGMPAVAEKTGKPVEGLKLSRHDMKIDSPSIAVAPDGTIHVAFVEQHATTFEQAVYHRSSSDGGKTWSEAKNLSEIMPGYKVGNCQVAIDGSGRVYVIWRTGVAEGYPVDMDPHSAGAWNNLVYRVLADGKWSGKAIPAHPAGTVEFQRDSGSTSWFVSTDPAARVHVVWNMMPRQLYTFTVNFGKTIERHDNGLGAGRVMETVLNGQDPGIPHEIYMAKVGDYPGYGKGCDNFDTISGYVDAAGQTHFIAKVTNIQVQHRANRIHLIENGTQTPAMELPGKIGDTWVYPPKLLLDAKGRRHIIAMYLAGERPNVQDYLVGSDDEPTVIRATKEVRDKLHGFQAYQGPNGRMVAIMEMNDTGKDTDDEHYLSTSDGGKWSARVNVTNNTGRESSFSRQTSTASHVASYTYWYPGPAATAYDREGHLLLIHVSNKRSAMESVALGWTLGSGSTVTPNLLFLRF